jgi:hypothetical protein
MAIKRDYKCPEHGFFEAWEPQCPQCDAEVAIVFLKAPTMRDSVVHGRTRHVDNTAKGLAKEFKMTDIKSAREGEAQSGYLARNNAPLTPQEREARPGDGVIWGGDNRYNMAGMLAGGMVKPVRDEQVGFSPKDANIKRGPIAASYVADHENLQVKVDK